MNSINSFSDLLAQGQISEALQLRLEAIETSARHYRQDLEAAKVSSAALGVIGLLLSANPLVAVIAGCGLAGYGYTVLRDYQNTKRLCLLPLVRKGTGELLTGIGLAAANEQGEADDPLLGVIGYVEPELAHEYELVMVAESQLTGYLAHLPGESRLNAYRHILRHTRLRNSLKLPSLQDVALAIASPVPSTKPTLPAVEPDSAPAIEVKAEVVQPTPSAQPTGERRIPTPPVQDVRDSFSRTSASLPQFDRDRIINESKGLMIVGDMGAAKTCVAQYIANGFNGYGIIVFDPHGMTDWGNAYVICKMGAIYEQMRILLDLLENGDTTPLLIVCDEWLEIRGDRRNKKGSEYAGLADDFIRLFSTKPRKFNKLAAFVLHSPNVEAAGVDSFLRENYLKIYLGRLAKKEFPLVKDCAYPCVLEDEQQEHPTHGHHAEFKPKGKTPRNLEPLQSAPINIPLAYMDGGEVKVCDRGWADGQLRLDVANIRNQLEMLYRDTRNSPSIDTDTSHQGKEKEGDTEPDTDSPSIDTGNDTDPTGTAETIANTSGDSGIGQIPDWGIDTSANTKRYTPALLTSEQMRILIQRMQSHTSQTQIIQDLWSVEKNKQGWKQAYAEYKELMGEG
jgi:hypothetical protein